MPTGGHRQAIFGALSAISLAGCASVPSNNVNDLHRATVLVKHQDGHGSGLIVGQDRILTAHHVTEGDGLKVSFFKGPSLDGRVVWGDAERDLALLDVDVPEGYPITSLSCERPVSGQHVMTVGHPIQSEWVLVGGYLPNSEVVADQYMSLGFPISLGTAGGPVFDDSGEVIGMILAILAERVPNALDNSTLKDTGVGLMRPASDFCRSVGIAVGEGGEG